MSQRDCSLCVELCKKEHVLRLWDNFAVIFNRYPYTAGHLMVVVRQHKRTLNDLTREQRAELIEVINDTQQRLIKVMNTDSSNIGLNTGEWSGASIPEHLHIHIVPRTNNDIGFYNLICKQTSFKHLEHNIDIWKAFDKNFDP